MRKSIFHYPSSFAMKDTSVSTAHIMKGFIPVAAKWMISVSIMSIYSSAIKGLYSKIMAAELITLLNLNWLPINRTYFCTRFSSAYGQFYPWFTCPPSAMTTMTTGNGMPQHQLETSLSQVPSYLKTQLIYVYCFQWSIVVRRPHVLQFGSPVRCRMSTKVK